MADTPEITAKGGHSSASLLRRLLDQHLKILSEHLSLWSSIKDEQFPGTRDYGAAQQCLDNTQVMIQNFQNLRMTFDNNTSKSADQQMNLDGLNAESGAQSSPQDQQRGRQSIASSATTDRTKPVKDVSDLFTIDTNPTPIESFQSSKAGKRAEKNLKRKLSQSKLHPIGLPEPLQETDGPRKRSKQDSAPGTIQAEIKPQPTTSNEKDDEDSFIAKVQQKHEEKETKRQKKLDKKRKRESNTSLDEFAAAKAKKPVKKKPKKDSSGVPERSVGNAVGQKRATTDSNSQTVSNNGPSKKRKKT